MADVLPIAERRRPLPVALDDDEIVGRIRRGEAVLFELLMRRHNQRVYRAIRSIVRDESEAEDVMQQAYLTAFEKLDQYRAEAAFSTWLTRIAVNEALGKKRQARRLVLMNDDATSNEDATMTSGKSSPEERASARELLGLVESAVERLPEIYRTVFVLREVERMSTTETAKALGTSEDVVRTRLRRARAMLPARFSEADRTEIEALFSFHAKRCDRVVAAVMQRVVTSIF